MRKTRLLPMGTGGFVGVKRIFVTLSAACVMWTATLEEFVTVPPLAVAELVAQPEAAAVNVTVIFVLWPGNSAPRFVHVKIPVATVVGGRLATALVSWANGKLSVTTTFVSVVLPVLTICKLN